MAWLSALGGAVGTAATAAGSAIATGATAVGTGVANAGLAAAEGLGGAITGGLNAAQAGLTGTGPAAAGAPGIMGNAIAGGGPGGMASGMAPSFMEANANAITPTFDPTHGPRPMTGPSTPFNMGGGLEGQMSNVDIGQWGQNAPGEFSNLMGGIRQGAANSNVGQMIDGTISMINQTGAELPTIGNPNYSGSGMAADIGQEAGGMLGRGGGGSQQPYRSIGNTPQPQTQQPMAGRNLIGIDPYWKPWV